MINKCERCNKEKHCVALDVDWTLYNCICEDCLEEIENENNRISTGMCYNCDGDLIGEYQVMIYDPELKFVKCCCEDCAEELKNTNEHILYERANTIRMQSIQILRR